MGSMDLEPENSEHKGARYGSVAKYLTVGNVF